ncbi:MerR family transcriptional regulator [Lentilactobacillus sp. Marseille-Q4993]|uniref:MerR family transcriptional regulator n=1 Tax=Lentilactobacillus sp. Marseille-Q4993 TaxID=3039492 RepID=UPI0024BD4FDD|nr:MerR family transcriptional regulator [Lentilactobacillus sp. Marseille-Q4993]
MQKLRISEFADQVGLTAFTLRYYENEGLIEPHRDANGRRYYVDQDIRWIKFLLHLKKTGMTMAEIEQYVTWRAQGDSTIELRRNLLQQVKKEAEEKVAELQASLEIVNHKIDWYDGKLDSSISEDEDFAEYMKKFQ